MKNAKTAPNTLRSMTGHETGILIYNGKTAAVCRWTECGDGEIPLVGSSGSSAIITPCQAEAKFSKAGKRSISNLRLYLIKRKICVLYDPGHEIEKILNGNGKQKAVVYSVKFYGGTLTVIAPDAWE